MRVFFTNLGCKLNQAELESLARQFAAAGHEITGSLAAADLHVVNSCTVTHVAARDSRKVARRGKRLNPGMRTVLTGCYAAAEPEAAAALAGVDLVVPNDAKHELVERALEAFPAPGDEASPLPIPYVPLAFGNTRALVKVEDGCNMRCSFCIIPFTRGRQRSRPLPAVVTEVGALAAGGYQEVVVTGVQISSYRDGGAGLFELTRALLRDTEVPRMRLTSIAPWQFDLRLLDLFGGGRLCRHFHLSLQSGCDPTLRRMRRPYCSRQFADLVARLRRAVPGVAITTDVIVGFPGESDAEFEETLAFCRSIGFARLHAFPYSPREGTAAADLPGQVPPPVKKERMSRLLEVARAGERAFWKQRLGETAQVLWERRRNGHWLGTTDNYVRVLAAANGEPPRRLATVRLSEISELGVIGQETPADKPRPERPRSALAMAGPAMSLRP